MDWEKSCVGIRIFSQEIPSQPPYIQRIDGLSNRLNPILRGAQSSVQHRIWPCL
jgi:hypothetical protein